MRRSRLSTSARYLLGAIRLVNGTAGLVTPVQFAERLGVDPKMNPAAIYILRLFGVRTAVIGAQLILLEVEELEAVLRPAVFIHATDAVAAGLAGMTGHLPRQTARTAVLISSFNVLLALQVLKMRGI